MLDNDPILFHIHRNRGHLLGIQVDTGDLVHKHLLLHLNPVTGLVKLGTACIYLKFAKLE